MLSALGGALFGKMAGSSNPNAPTDNKIQEAKVSSRKQSLAESIKSGSI